MPTIIDYDFIQQQLHDVFLLIAARVEDDTTESKCKIQDEGYPETAQNCGYYHFNTKARNAVSKALTDYYAENNGLSIYGKTTVLKMIIPLVTGDQFLLLGDDNFSQTSEFWGFLDLYSKTSIEMEQQFIQKMDQTLTAGLALTKTDLTAQSLKNKKATPKN